MESDQPSLDLFVDTTPSAEPVAEGAAVWTVSQVNRALRHLVEGSIRPLWVIGEIGAWKRARSGHCYFTLKDDAAQIRCVLFRSDADRLPVEPEDGMEVRAFGSLTVYEARGDHQLVVRRLDSLGQEGFWRLAFERLREKLSEEGLLAPERRRPLPPLPSRIGVVTSASGAAFQDIVSVVARRAPWSRILLRSTRVQGEGAANEIAAAIELLGSSGRVDVLIVGRGGGGPEDLWPFNEEPVARAIVACPVPVISAVGHEIDVTIADLVADLRAPTPSAAAEAVVGEGGVIRGGVETAVSRLAGSLQGMVHGRRRHLDDASSRLDRALAGMIPPRRQLVDRWEERMEAGMRRGLMASRAELTSLLGRLEALSPLATMRRGYAVPLDTRGGAVRSAAELDPGMMFRLRMIDGEVDCEARQVRLDPASAGEPSHVQS